MSTLPACCGADGVGHLLWLSIAMPAAGAVLLLLGGKRTDPWGHLLGCAAAIASFAVTVRLFIGMLDRPAEDRTISRLLFSWIPADALQVDLGLQVDQLSMCFALLITGVGSLIHIYSIGYMADDPDRRRFFGYLNLFIRLLPSEWLYL